MARTSSGPPYGASALALVTAFWLGTFLAAGQTPGDEADPAFLDARRAAKFALKREPPEYPLLAKLNYIQGPVRVQVTVSKEGRVEEAHVVRGHPFLAVAALKAVRNWLFRPAKARPGPQEFRTLVDVKFLLHPRKNARFPPQPEQDLTRQIRPPQVLGRESGSASAASVRLRLLVSSEGKVIDSQFQGGCEPCVAEARRIAAHWTFRPARWGALPVPWYLEVEVPVGSWPTARSAAEARAW
jgi:TonB family protein